MGKISKVNLKKVGFRELRNRYYARLEKFGGGRPLFKTEAEAVRCYDSAEVDIKNKTFVKIVNAKTFAECAGTYDKDYFHQTKKKIFVFDGDGNILMNLGSLVTIGALQPKNLIHLIFDS